MRVFIASPYAGNKEENTRLACDYADAVSRLGHYPYIPHLNMYWHRPPGRSHEFWQDQDFTWLRLCDAVLRMGGPGRGADAEVAEAEKVGMPVYYSIDDLERLSTDRTEYAAKLKLFRAWLDALRNGITTKDNPEFIALKVWLTDNFSADKIGLFIR
jgi:hypothetical protein